VTHYWFPRKWIASIDPCERLDGPHWFPDWQLRLFRNDRALVWKPARPHSGYRVQGPGYREARACILHFEPLLCGVDARVRKRERYRKMGADPLADEQFAFGPDAPRLKAAVRPPSTARARTVRGIVDGTVHRLRPLPAPWGSTIVRVEMPGIVRGGERFIAEVHARNSGSVAWAPFYGERSAQIHLGSHLLDGEGRLIDWDLSRCPVLKFVAPGDSALFLCSLQAPATPGRYLLEWDFVSEGECWFAECGSGVQRTPVEVAV
jgi:hypothetical protein